MTLTVKASHIWRIAAFLCFCFYHWNGIPLDFGLQLENSCGSLWWSFFVVKSLILYHILHNIFKSIAAVTLWWIPSSLKASRICHCLTFEITLATNSPSVYCMIKRSCHDTDKLTWAEMISQLIESSIHRQLINYFDSCWCQTLVLAKQEM